VRGRLRARSHATTRLADAREGVAAVPMASGGQYAIVFNARQQRVPRDGVIERVMARSAFANIRIRKIADDVYFFGSRRVVITDGASGMPHVKAGRHNGPLDEFVESNGRTEITRARGLQAALATFNQQPQQSFSGSLRC